LPLVTDFNKYRFFLVEGGRGSSKSQSVARFLLFLGDKRKVRVVCGREIQANIEESVYTLLKDLITQYSLAYDVLAHEIRHKVTGTTFKFKGFREQGSVSVKGLEGVDILWIDEAQSITKTTLDIIMPTIRKDKAKLFFTMNRFMMDDAVPELLIGDPQCLHIQINYFENQFCPLNLKVQAENMRNKSLRDYEHVWLGKPLAAADDYLFNHSKLHKAFEIKPYGDLLAGNQRVIGIDFAAQGNDQCVATILDRASNQHWQVTEQIAWDESDTTVSVGKIVDILGKFKPQSSIIDIGGMGKPVYDRLLEVGMSINPFDGGSTDGVDTSQVANCRAKGYFLLKEWFDEEFLCIDKQKNVEVIKQLEKIRFKYRSNGSKIMQPKLEMKSGKNGVGYSPDNADSLMMAVYCAVMYLGKPANNTAQQSNNIKRVSGSTRGRKR